MRRHGTLLVLTAIAAVAGAAEPPLPTVPAQSVTLWCLEETDERSDLREIEPGEVTSCLGETFVESETTWGHGRGGENAVSPPTMPGGTVTVELQGSHRNEVPAHFVARGLVEAKGKQSVKPILCRAEPPRTERETRALSCAAPAGLTTLSLDFPTLATELVWDLDLKAGAETSVTLEPRPGVRVFGAVSVPNMVARVVPNGVSAEDATWDLASRVEELPAGGDFEIDRLAPGSYLYRIESPSGKVATAEVVIPASATTFELPDLEPPISVFVEIQVQPAVDGLDAAWKLTLSPKHSSRGSTPPRRVHADLTGWARLEDLQPGEHVLLVEDSDGSLWWSETVEVGHHETVLVDLPHVTIQGNARIGRDPFEGTLIFGTTQGVQRVSIATDEDGRFQGLLPREGEWSVEVEATGPSCGACDGAPGSIRVPPVTVEKGPSGVARVEIDIPDTRVTGRVVLEEVRSSGEVVRRPQEGALIVVARNTGPSRDRGRLAQVWTDDEGRFELLGLAPGPVMIAATSREPTAESQFVSFDLQEGLRPAEIELVLTEKVILSPRVAGPFGRVGGARVTAFLPDGISAHGTTSADGTVALAVPPGRVGTLTVQAEGYGLAFQTLQTPVGEAETEEIAVRVTPGEGTLVLGHLRDDVFESGILISESGGRLPLRVLSSLAPGSVTYGATVTISGLAPQRYQFCIGAQDCWSETVFPDASTEIDLSHPGD